MGRAVVIGEHTLGTIMPNGVQVLRSSVLRGSPYEGYPEPGVIALAGNWRHATREDFEVYRVGWHPDYTEHESIRTDHHPAATS